MLSFDFWHLELGDLDIQNFSDPDFHRFLLHYLPLTENVVLYPDIRKPSTSHFTRLEESFLTPQFSFVFHGQWQQLCYIIVTTG